MQEVINLILGYVRGAWRYRWLAIAVAWVIAPIGWFYVHQLQDRYESSAKVYVDTRSALRPLMRGLAIESNVNEQLTQMTRMLLSRQNLEKVARMTDLDLNTKDPTQMDGLVGQLRGQIKLSKGKDSNIYTIACEHPNPELAKRIVQSLLTLFVEGTIGTGREDAVSAQRFLDKQIAEYQLRLEESERRLKRFRQENYELMPGRSGGFYEALNQTQSKLEQSQLEMRESENRRDALRLQLDAEEPDLKLAEEVLQASKPPEPEEITTVYDERIQRIQIALDSLLLRFTDRHPDVMAAKETLASLQEKRKQRLDEIQKRNEAPAIALDEELIDEPTGSSGGGTNPVFQQLKIALGQSEANLASIRARANEYERRIVELQERVDSALDVEAKLKGLNRDYDVLKKNYDTLIGKRETARLSEQVDNRSQNVKFKIIDPPRLPKKPAAPNRVVLISVVLVVSLLAGVGLALLISMTRPTFDNRRTLNEVTGFPVLGGVSMTWTPEQRSRRRMQLAAFIMSGVSLFAVFAGVLAMQMLNIDVNSYVTQLKEIIS